MWVPSVTQATAANRASLAGAPKAQHAACLATIMAEQLRTLAVESFADLQALLCAQGKV